MSFFQQRFKSIMSDRLLSASYLVAIAEAACHIYEITENGFQMAELIRAIFCGVYVIAVFFICSRKAIFYVFSGMALSILYFNKYTNYTSFFIIALTIQRMPYLKVPLLVAYSADVLICLFIGHRMAHHEIIHMLNCAWIYVVLNLEFKKPSRLNLTSDERQILDEWITVGELKAVECFSRKTVFDKLKDARVRNGLSGNDELKDKYIMETKIPLD